MLLTAFLLRLRSSTDGPGQERRRTLIAPDSLRTEAAGRNPASVRVQAVGSYWERALRSLSARVWKRARRAI